jgi:hypothetical protein
VLDEDEQRRITAPTKGSTSQQYNDDVPSAAHEVDVEDSDEDDEDADPMQRSASAPAPVAATVASAPKKIVAKKK